MSERTNGSEILNLYALHVTASTQSVLGMHPKTRRDYFIFTHFIILEEKGEKNQNWQTNKNHGNFRSYIHTVMKEMGDYHFFFLREVSPSTCSRKLSMLFYFLSYYCTRYTLVLLLNYSYSKLNIS